MLLQTPLSWVDAMCGCLRIIVGKRKDTITHASCSDIFCRGRNRKLSGRKGKNDNRVHRDWYCLPMTWSTTKKSITACPPLDAVIIIKLYIYIVSNMKSISIPFQQHPARRTPCILVPVPVLSCYRDYRLIEHLQQQSAVAWNVKREIFLFCTQSPFNYFTWRCSSIFFLSCRAHT